MFRQALRPTQCVPEISRPEREVDNSPPTNAQVKNECSYAFTSTCHQVVHRYNLTFSLLLPFHSVSHLCVIEHTALNIKGQRFCSTTKFQTRSWINIEFSFILEQVIRRERNPRTQQKRTGGFQSWSGSGRGERSPRFCKGTKRRRLSGNKRLHRSSYPGSTDKMVQ